MYIICRNTSLLQQIFFSKICHPDCSISKYTVKLSAIFGTGCMFSISCPLITPFGLIYFCLKYFVDRHNLAFIYAPSKINKEVHVSAINFVVFSVGLLQFFMVAFTILRTGEIANLTPLSKYTLILFVLTINIFTAQVWASTCKKLSPIKYVDDLYNEETEDDFKTEYLPDVLKDTELAGTLRRNSQRVVSVEPSSPNNVRPTSE